MNNITKNLQIKIILLPIVLIVLTSTILALYEVAYMKEYSKQQIERKTQEYLKLHKEDVKTNVYNIKDSIEFHLEKLKEHNHYGSLQKLQNMILQRYSKRTQERYIFIYKVHNIKGGKEFATMILNQNKPEIVGKKISDDVSDLMGSKYRKEMLKLIQKDGEGFVKYWYKKPNSDEIHEKMSFFYYQKDWQWIIAQGFYFDSLQKEIEAFEQDIAQEIKQYITTTVKTAVALSLIAIFISILLSRRIIRLLNYYIDMISQNEKRFTKRLERFIDTQDNIVILTDGEKLNFANKRLFTFLGFKDFDSFIQKHDCVCELFIENDRFFHLGKIQKDENWLHVMRKMPHSKRIVSIMGDNFSIHAFSVTINVFDSSLYIVSFTDISQTMLEHIKLQEKTIHDPLTNAFNREYFEQNYERLIQEYTQNSSKLAIAVLDIDHFKLVNDNFGHDVGDEVLKGFVSTIQKYSRKDDILIRWGGEEFILILKVHSKDDLQRALEHIRKVISMQNFDKVGKKTCSIGGTIYQPDEAITKTIKRADEAVYEAKARGRDQVVIEE